MKSIDLTKFRGPSSTQFTGRPQGQQARSELNIDTLDVDETTPQVEFLIPESTTSFNPSFYLGLVFDSYLKLGLDKFKEKYSFKIQTSDLTIKRIINKNLEDGERNAINSLLNKTGLN